MSVFKSIELNKEFTTKEARNDSLLANSGVIIETKKANIYKSVEKGVLLTYDSFKSSTTKSLFDMKLKHFYPTINTTKLMDSHRDVHDDGLWDDTLKIVSDSLIYTTDHELAIDNVISFEGEVKAFTKMVSWSDLGQKMPGETQALIYEINEDNIFHDKARKIISKRIPIQNSVRMAYDEILLAINDDRIEFKDNKDLFDFYIGSIVNKELALQEGYFWLIKKASIIMEGSMVLKGSNKVTPILVPEEKQIISVEQKEIVLPKREILNTAYKHFI